MNDENYNEDYTKKNDDDGKSRGKVKGFFQKLGQKLDEASYEYRLKADFDKTHPYYGVYSGTPLIDVKPDITCEEHTDENYLITLSLREDIKEGNLIKKYSTNEVFHIAQVQEIKYKTVFDGKETQVDALKIVLGERAQRVQVIKIEGNYYLK